MLPGSKMPRRHVLQPATAAADYSFLVRAPCGVPTLADLQRLPRPSKQIPPPPRKAPLWAAIGSRRYQHPPWSTSSLQTLFFHCRRGLAEPYVADTPTRLRRKPASVARILRYPFFRLWEGGCLAVAGKFLSCRGDCRRWGCSPSTVAASSHPVGGLPENGRASVDIFLKAAGYLDFAVRHVLPRLTAQFSKVYTHSSMPEQSSRKDIPLDLSAGVLRALCGQALGQAVDIQLGMAIDNPSATLAVKRRLACELVKCWHQAYDNIFQIPFNDGWGAKYQLFVKWKYTEAKVKMSVIAQSKQVAEYRKRSSHM
ncbi:hypothetical protein Taro_000490 [Colocasia esculenta]|uniref:Uncharacterized protein n=1 Tax=Colocasia esculenta TaxID=4460 RepID=A0A843THM9_COLES|nr:hypothetical protein [Colocasia esculenta]